MLEKVLLKIKNYPPRRYLAALLFLLLLAGATIFILPCGSDVGKTQMTWKIFANAAQPNAASVVQINCNSKTGHYLVSSKDSAGFSDQQATALCQKLSSPKYILPDGDRLCRGTTGSQPRIEMEGLVRGKQFSAQYPLSTCSNPEANKVFYQVGSLLGISKPPSLPPNAKQLIMVLPDSQQDRLQYTLTNRLPEDQRWYNRWKNPDFKEMQRLSARLVDIDRSIVRARKILKQNPQMPSEAKVLMERMKVLSAKIGYPPCTLSAPQDPYQRCTLPTKEDIIPLRTLHLMPSQIKALQTASPSQIIEILTNAERVPVPPGWPGYISPNG